MQKNLNNISNNSLDKLKIYRNYSGEIFSFRYSLWKSIWRIGMGVFALLCLSVWLISSVKDNDGENTALSIFILLFLIFLIFLVLCSIVDALFTKNIILYEKKILKEWIFGISKEILFDNCVFQVSKTPFMTIIRFYPQSYGNFYKNMLFIPFFQVYYDQTVMKYKDISVVNEILSDISGRDIVHFVKDAWPGMTNLILTPFVKER